MYFNRVNLYLYKIYLIILKEIDKKKFFGGINNEQNKGNISIKRI